MEQVWRNVVYAAALAAPGVGLTAPEPLRWLPLAELDGAGGRVQAAEAHARLADCDAALDALAAFEAEPGCAPAGCEHDEAYRDRVDRARRIEGRCVVDRAGLAPPPGGRVEVDGASRPGGIVAGARRLTYILPDGRRLSRALCVRPAAPPTLRFEPDDRRTVSTEGDDRTRARAHVGAARAHVQAQAWCEAALAFEAARARVAKPELAWNAALAQHRRPDGCLAAQAAFGALAAVDLGPQLSAEAEQLRLETRARCAAGLSVSGLAASATLTLNGRPAPDPRSTDPQTMLPGVYRIEVHAPPRPAMGAYMALLPGQTRRLAAPPPPAVPPPPPDPPPPTLEADREASGWLWAPLVAVGVGLAAGATFTALAIDDIEDHDAAVGAAGRDSTRSYLAQQQAALDDFDRDRALAFVGWGLAAAGAVIFAAGWGLGGVVTPTGDGASVAVGGRF